MTRLKTLLIILVVCTSIAMIAIRQFWHIGEYSGNFSNSSNPSNNKNEKENELPTAVKGPIERYFASYDFGTTGTLSEEKLDRTNFSILIPRWQRHIYTGVRYLVWNPLHEDKYYYALVNPANRTFGDPLIIALNQRADELLFGKKVEVHGYLKLRRVKIGTETSDMFILYAEKIKLID